MNRIDIEKILGQTTRLKKRVELYSGREQSNPPWFYQDFVRMRPRKPFFVEEARCIPRWTTMGDSSWIYSYEYRPCVLITENHILKVASLSQPLGIRGSYLNPPLIRLSTTRFCDLINEQSDSGFEFA